MKILCISDSHGQHEHFTEAIRQTPADVLIHAGDVTANGLTSQAVDFMEWLDGFEHIPHKLFIAGNHDTIFERGASLIDWAKTTFPSLTYLQNSEVVINGVKFWGSPYTPKFMDWSFMYRPGPPAQALWEQIPADTDVLITHGPPKNVLDKVIGWGGGHVGCEALKSRIVFAPPKLHVFGHIHNGYGQLKAFPQLMPDPVRRTVHSILVETDMHHPQAIKFVNAALLNEDYQPVNSPILIDL